MAALHSPKQGMMATPKKSPRKKTAAARRTSRKTHEMPRSRWPRVLLILAVLAGVAAYAYRAPLSGYSQAGAAYGARIGCSCRFVDGRELASCKTDMEDGMGLVFLSEDDKAKSVTARVPLLASATARYRRGWGCVLDKWDD